ncbi:MAG: exodeoxyribonuclease VII large subunit [Candidatus Coatesbacteria bacterium]|nr:exodeoxyribonuclease VII large subunit [Candidatus Coatesbacteria bacterium]
MNRELDFSAAVQAQDRKIFKVSELATQIKALLQNRFFDIWVEGEITDFKRSSAGHLYMRLKDDKAQISAVMFRNKAIFLQFKPENGLSVIARGSVSCYPPSSTYQVIVDYFEPKGVGALQLAFEQLKAKLNAEGLFAPERKRPIPKMPKTIGVVTSPTGAAIRDILNVTKRRFCSAHIILYPVQVQGEKAPAEIKHAIEEMNRLELAEVLIVGRGGGAAIDLWAFNDEGVARAIAASKIPVISAVGHEIDFTIADFVADLRAPTPSAAAELVVQSRAELLSKTDSLRSRLTRVMLSRTSAVDQRLESLLKALRMSSPERPIQTLMQRLDDVDLRLQRVTLALFENRRQQLSHLSKRHVALAPTKTIAAGEALLQGISSRLMAGVHSQLRFTEARLNSATTRLESLKPQNVIRRGYAICQDAATGKPISRTSHARIGASVLVVLADGSLGCQVNDISRSSSDDVSR